MNIKKGLVNIMRARHPAKLALTRILFHLGISHFLSTRWGPYRLRFFPTALSSAIFYDPTDRWSDTWLIRAVMAEGGVFVDAGANIGLTALAAAGSMRGSGHIFAYEAHPLIGGYLEKNITINAVANVTVRKVALGAKRGTVEFSSGAADDVNHVVADGKAAKSVRVPMVRLDDDLQNASLASIALIKVDTEGFEEEVLRGANFLLSRANVVQIEVIGSHLKKFGSTPSRIGEMLRESGFDLFRFEGEALTPLSALTESWAGELVGVRKAKLSSQLLARLGISS